jgi:hypothetical protein
VAVLDEEYRRLIGAETQTVYMSDETLAKQRGWIEGIDGHPELTIQEYQKLPDVIANGQFIVQDSEFTIIFIKYECRFYHAVVKATRSGKALFLTSFRRLDDIRREINRIKRKKGVKILKEEF